MKWSDVVFFAFCSVLPFINVKGQTSASCIFESCVGCTYFNRASFDGWHSSTIKPNVAAYQETIYETNATFGRVSGAFISDDWYFFFEMANESNLDLDRVSVSVNVTPKPRYSDGCQASLILTFSPNGRTDMFRLVESSLDDCGCDLYHSDLRFQFIVDHHEGLDCDRTYNIPMKFVRTRLAFNNIHIEEDFDLAFSLNHGQIYGPTPVCGADSWYGTSTYIEPEFNTWSISNTQVTTWQPNSEVTGVYPNGYNGEVILQAEVHHGEMGSRCHLYKPIYFGIPPAIEEITHVDFGCTEGEVYADGMPQSSGTTINWIVNGGVFHPSGLNEMSCACSTVLVDPIDGPYGFTVIATPENICGVNTSYSKHIETNCSGGEVTPKSTLANLNEVSRNDNLTIFPNPASDFLILEAESIEDVSITNLLGIRETSYTQISTKRGLTVDVSNLPSGSYFISVLKSDGELLTRRFMVY